MQAFSIAQAGLKIRKPVCGDGGWLNGSRRPQVPGKQGPGNPSNCGEHVLGVGGGVKVVNRQAAGRPICQPVPQRRLCVSSMTNRITEDN